MRRLSPVLAGLALSACMVPLPRQSATVYHNLAVCLVAESGGERLLDWSGKDMTAVEPVALFTGADFDKIDVSRQGGDDKKSPALWLRFTPEGARRFEEATTRYTGRRFAFLVSGKVVTAPKILHPVTTGLFEITGPSDAEIEAMYRAITAPGL